METFKKIQGVTIIEMLLVVAIIGILVAIGQASYRTIAFRVKNAGAKALLASLYSAEVVYKGEFNTYSTRFDSLGFGLEGIVYHSIGFSLDRVPSPEEPQGTSTCTTSCGFLVGGALPVCRSPIGWTCADSARCGMDAAIMATSTANDNSFLASTHAHYSGCINPADAFTFTINQNKRVMEITPAQ